MTFSKLARFTTFQLVTILVLVTFVSCRKAPAASPAPAAAARAGQTPAPHGAAPAAPAVKPVPAQLPAVVARVNGEPISRTEFEAAVHSLEARNGSPVPANRRNEILRAVLDQLVTYHLLEQEARAKKVVVPQAELNARFTQIEKQFRTQAAFDQALAAQGTSEAKLKDSIRNGLMVSRVLDEEASANIAVTDAQVAAFYAAHKTSFAEKASVRASHILIAVPKNATPAQKAAARAKAERLLKQIKAGANFAALAKANSDDPGSAAHGGDLGYFQKGQMVPAFEKAAFALQPGQVSGIVETQFGFHIIKVTGRRPARTASLAEVKQDIKNFLTNQARQKQEAQLIAALRQKSKIEIYF